MRCCICKKEINGGYYSDDSGKNYCSDKCYETILPTCCICGQKMKQWTESDGKKYCSEKCYQKSWHKCYVCQKPMKSWTETKDGRKYCSDKCYEITLPKCTVCEKRMHEWIDIDGKKYCDKTCLSKTFKYYRLNDVENKMKLLGYQTLDVLLIGATGVGKSATINSLLKKEIAGVGYSTEPKTMKVGNYILSNSIQIWDTPGLGDGIDADKEHSKKIIDQLHTRITGDPNYGFIDMAVLVIEASIRDMGTVFQLMNNVIIPNINDENRIIIGLNQADFAMKGQNYDYKNNLPNEILKTFLEEKANSVKRRIKETTGFNIKVVYYSAETGYNVEKFLDSIIDYIPSNKRYLG